MTISQNKNQSAHRLFTQKYFPIPARIIIVLIYTLSMIIAAEEPLSRHLADNNEFTNIFSSPETAMVFLRLLAVGWALCLALFQGIILGILFSIITRSPRPKITMSWIYVITAQIPSALSIFGLYAFGGFSATQIITTPLITHLIGLFTVLLFSFFAGMKQKIEPKRIFAFTVFAFAINSALLLLMI